MSLYAELTEIAENIRKHREVMDKSEAAVEQVSVVPFIEALGYQTYNLTEVRKQYPILNTDAVDYAILRDDLPVIFVEAKSASNLLQNKEWKQLFQYFNAEIGLRFGILTNGVVYRFYTDLKADNIMDKEPFLTLDMLNLDERLVADLEGFTKAGFDPQRVFESAQRQVTARLMQQEMASPSDGIVLHFAQQLYSGNVNARVIKQFRPIVKQAWQDLVRDKRMGKPCKPGPKKPPSPKNDYVVEIPIFGQYKGERFNATLLLDTRKPSASKVRLRGADWSVSRAAREAIWSKFPGAKVWVGWKWWMLHDHIESKNRLIRELTEDKDLLRRLSKSE